jgi:hypothetical protein
MHTRTGPTFFTLIDTAFSYLRLRALGGTVSRVPDLGYFDWSSLFIAAAHIDRDYFLASLQQVSLSMTGIRLVIPSTCGFLQDMPGLKVSNCFTHAIGTQNSSFLYDLLSSSTYARSVWRMRRLRNVRTLTWGAILRGNLTLRIDSGLSNKMLQP